MKDNLESFFKKYLNRDNPVSKDWNTPSDDVWMRASQVLDEKEKDKKIFWLWGLVGFLTIGLVLSGLYISTLVFDNNLDNKSNTVQNQESLEQKTSRGTSIINESILHKIKDDNLVSKSEINSIMEGERLSSELDRNNGKTNTNLSNITSGIIKNGQSMLSSKGQFDNTALSTTVDSTLRLSKVKSSNQQNLSSDYSRSVISTSNNSFISSIPPLETLKSYLKTTLDIDIYELNSSMIINPIPKIERHRKNEISVGGGPSLTSTPMKDSRNKVALTGYKKLQVSSNFGLKYRHYFKNNYFVIIGANYLTVKSWSFSNTKYNYNSQGEYGNTTGDVFNNLILPLPSPVGEMSTNITIRQSKDNSINDGDPFIAGMDSHQEYQYINIPIGLGVSKSINNKHRLMFSLDFNVSYLLSRKNTFEVSLSYDDNKSKMEMVNSSMGSFKKTNKQLFSISGELGYQYRLTNNKFLDLSVSYYRSLNNLYSTEYVSTKVHGINFNTGVSIKF